MLCGLSEVCKIERWNIKNRNHSHDGNLNILSLLLSTISWELFSCWLTQCIANLQSIFIRLIRNSNLTWIVAYYFSIIFHKRFCEAQTVQKNLINCLNFVRLKALHNCEHISLLFYIFHSRLLLSRASYLKSSLFSESYARAE